jgi:hypothetical protein
MNEMEWFKKNDNDDSDDNYVMSHKEKKRRDKTNDKIKYN